MSDRRNPDMSGSSDRNRSDEALDSLILRAAQDYREPASTPRERIWAGIQARHRPRARTTKIVDLQRLLIPLAAAAVLLLGIGIGRFGLTGDSDSVTGEIVRGDVANTAAPVDGSPGVGSRYGASAGLERAAVQHLSRAEVLLTRFRAGTGDVPDEGRFVTRAAGLLGETRLLLDSPLRDDPATRVLLEDLELVLARIVRSSSERGVQEREWISEGMNERGLLPRLRTKIPAGMHRSGA